MADLDGGQSGIVNMKTTPISWPQRFQTAISAAAAGRMEEAIGLFRSLAAEQPGHWEVWARLATAYEARRDWTHAGEAYRKATALNPTMPGLHCNLGMVLLAMRSYAEAHSCFEAALELSDVIPEVYNGKGVALKGLNRFEEAVQSFQKAIAMRSGEASWWCNLGNTLTGLDRFAEAHRVYDRALQLKPGCGDAVFGKSLAYLQEGRLHEGFALYESRWESEMEGCRPRFEKPEWDGVASLEGKCLLVRCEQGIGDSVQFVRYAALLKARGARVVLEVQPTLISLCKTVPGVVDAFPEGRAPLDYDYACSLLSLPRLMGTTLSTIPSAVPYMTPQPDRVAWWRQRFADNPRPWVGLVSSGNLKHKNNYNRLIPVARFAELFHRGGGTFFLLQKDVPAADRTFLEQNPFAADLGTEFVDFGDTAAAMANLDLIVSVDTSLAHLAGAMSKPVWTLLSRVADWRWMIDRTDSPWYPTMRLFRQEKPGDWTNVLAELGSAWTDFNSTKRG